jgi:seryl-tRNA synthetase
MSERHFLDDLFDAGLLVETGVDGLYLRGGVFEDVVERLDALAVASAGDDEREVLRFPPAMNRMHFERSGYLKSFPQLAGTVHSFCGDDKGHELLLKQLAEGEDWTQEQKATDVVLNPAACYPLYPMVARRGPLPQGGGLFDIMAYCFRREPSKEATRMQLFRMHEFVRVGTPEQVMAFRELWLDRGQGFVASLQLPFTIDVANDPFFGRGGRMMASSQREQKLKFELLIPVNGEGTSPTACMSFNYHQDHFGTTWGIRTHDGETAHTACVGFGLERLSLALFRHHGLDPKQWPAKVRQTLWPAR